MQASPMPEPKGDRLAILSPAVERVLRAIHSAPMPHCEAGLHRASLRESRSRLDRMSALAVSADSFHPIDIQTGSSRCIVTSFDSPTLELIQESLIADVQTLRRESAVPVCLAENMQYHLPFGLFGQFRDDRFKTDEIVFSR